MKYIILMIGVLFMTSCSISKNVRKVHKGENTEELTEFREYLLKKI